MDTEIDCEEDHCSDHPVNYSIAEIIVHDGYQPHSKNREHDIALIRLSHSAKFTFWIKPLCLPTASTLRGLDYGDETTFVVAGWGATEVINSLTYNISSFFHNIQTHFYLLFSNHFRMVNNSHD